MSTSNGEPYSRAVGVYKSIKDGGMLIMAAVIATAGMNVTGLVEQCPEATVTFFGVTIGLKVLMQFFNNYRKNS